MASSPPPPTSRNGSSSGQGGAAPTQLEFTQAMTDFKVMFPDLEADVIEAVLRANNGAVDITIDHLLTMTADYEAAKSGTGTTEGQQQQQSTTGTSSGDDKPPAYTGHPPPSYQQALKDEGGVFTDDLINLGQDESGQKQQQQQQSQEQQQQEHKHSIPQQQTGSGSGDLLSDFDSLGASGGATTSAHSQSAASKDNSASASEAAKFGSSPKHAYSHPKRQEADDQEFQSSQSSSSQPNILPTQQQLHEIYEENLRLREEVGKNPTGFSASDAAARNQYLEDERIALMLQNEEFMAELRRDTDFMTALEMEHERANLAATESSKLHTSGSGGAEGAGASGGKAKGMLDDELFRDKLKNMGKTSKKKFSQLAAIFSRRKSAAKQLLGGHAGAGPSKDNLLLNAEPLVNEDDSDTEEDNTNTNGKKQKTPTKGKYTSFS